MDKTRVWQILCHFTGDIISESWFVSNGVTKEELSELLELGYIIFIGNANKNPAYTEDNPQYVITEEGKAAIK